ncbi:MAG: condensation domain-containing protein, partial [Cyanobacteria bacterium P01_F01_bin.53]
GENPPNYFEVLITAADQPSPLDALGHSESLNTLQQNQIQAEKSSTEEIDFRQQLLTASASQAQVMLQDRLVSGVAKMLGLVSIGDLDPSQPLELYGLDSLMTIELRNWLLKVMQVDVPIIKLVKSMTIDDLSQLLWQSLTTEQPNTQTPPPDQAPPSQQPPRPESISSIHDQSFALANPESTLAETTEGKVDNNSNVQTSIHSYPLNPSQLLFCYGTDTSNSNSTLEVRLRLNVEIAIDSIFDACKRIIERYDTLTTLLGSNQLQTKGRSVLPGITVPVVRYSPHLKEADIQSHFKDFTRVPFDRACGPLIRFQVSQINQNDRELWIVVDHIATDAYSMAILMRELDVMLSGESLTEPKSYYGSALTGWTNASNIKFWRGYLKKTPLLKVPPLRPVQLEGRASQPIPQEILTQLQLQYKGAIELKATIIAATASAIANVTNQSALTVGVPTHDRTQETTEIFGPFFRNDFIVLRQIMPEIDHLLDVVKHEIKITQPHQQVPDFIKFWLMQQSHIPVGWRWVPGALANLSGLQQKAQCLGHPLGQAFAEFTAGGILRRVLKNVGGNNTLVIVNILPSFVDPKVVLFRNSRYIPSFVNSTVADSRLMCWFTRDSQNQPTVFLEGGVEFSTRKEIAAHITTNLTNLLSIPAR